MRLLIWHELAFSHGLIRATPSVVQRESSLKIECLVSVQMVQCEHRFVGGHIEGKKEDFAPPFLSDGAAGSMATKRATAFSEHFIPSRQIENMCAQMNLFP